MKKNNDWIPIEIADIVTFKIKGKKPLKGTVIDKYNVSDDIIMINVDVEGIDFPLEIQDKEATKIGHDEVFEKVISDAIVERNKQWIEQLDIEIAELKAELDDKIKEKIEFERRVGEAKENKG